MRSRLVFAHPGGRVLRGKEPFGPPLQTSTRQAPLGSNSRGRSGHRRRGRGLCLAPAASASTVADTATATTTAANTAAANTGATDAAIRSAADASAAPLVTTYTVRRGDSLSSIAGHLYHDRAAWPVLYWQNRKTHSVGRRDLRWPGAAGAAKARRRHLEPPDALGPIAPTASAASPTAMRVGTGSAGAAAGPTAAARQAARSAPASSPGNQAGTRRS